MRLTFARIDGHILIHTILAPSLSKSAPQSRSQYLAEWGWVVAKNKMPVGEYAPRIDQTEGAWAWERGKAQIA
jgi:hypothetical protein